MRSVEACAGCGASLAPAASFLTEAGSLCRQCFASYQNDQEERSRVAAETDLLISRRTKLLARTHAFIWGVTAILAAEALRMSDGVGTVMFLAALSMAIGLAMRRRWAFLAALALDGAGTVCLAILAVMAFKPGRSWIGLFVPPFTLGSGFVLWRARAYFPSKAPDSISTLR